MTYLERYLNGEYERVWTDLIQLGKQVHREEIYEDALGVAQETMRRVRKNIEVLIPHLLSIGFIFGYDHRLRTQLAAVQNALVNKEEEAISILNLLALLARDSQEEIDSNQKGVSYSLSLA